MFTGDLAGCRTLPGLLRKKQGQREPGIQTEQVNDEPDTGSDYRDHKGSGISPRVTPNRLVVPFILNPSIYYRELSQ
jgi:hypothetical protein